MTRLVTAAALLGWFLVLDAWPVHGSQATADQIAPAQVSVPRAVQFSGTLVDGSGSPRSGILSVTFAIYASQLGGAPLWVEQQTVRVARDGRYTVLLGSTRPEGLPVELFSSNEARWLGVQAAGEPEQPRVVLLSVPYALKASDADTLGGKPASAYLTAAPDATDTSSALSATAAAAPAPAAPGGGGGTPSPIAPMFTATANPGPGFVSQATSGPPLQVSSAAVVANLNADFLDGFHESAFAKLTAANVFTGNQTVNGSLTASGLLSALSGSFSGSTGLDAGGVPVPLVRVVQQGAQGNGLFVENTQNGFGVALWARAVNFPIKVTATSGSAIGIRADATSPTGQTNGLLGVAFSTDGFGVRGDAIATSGNNKGVFGQSFSTAGVGVEGVATATSGAAAGVRGIAASVGGAGGWFENTGGGDLIVGGVGGQMRFRVDGSGALYAASYRDLAGNPIPAGTGDITSVNAGGGLSGGGASGDVSVALDTAFTDARYAPSVHGHDVSQILNAASRGANSFVGDQSITGNLAVSASASVDGGLAAFGGPTKPNAVGVRGETSSNTAEGVLGVSISTSGRGVRGYTTGASGIGVKAEAESTTGTTTGVLATVASPAGVAGVFDNTAGGDLVRGAVQGTQKFRVDGTGAVYANSYLDLAGNPIPSGTGDITGVTAGGGLTGGGATGDVTVTLDTAVTDARYAPFVHGHDVSQVANAATLGANTFAGDQTITGTLRASAYRDLAGNPIPTGQDVLAQTLGATALTPNTHQVVATQPVTTASSDVVVVAYNLVLRNLNAAGTACSVISYALMDGVPGRQTVIQVMPGVGSGGQTIPFTPGSGSHTVSINAYTSCSNMSVDVTSWIGGVYGSTVTTTLVKR